MNGCENGRENGHETRTGKGAGTRAGTWTRTDGEERESGNLGRVCRGNRGGIGRKTLERGVTPTSE